MTTPPSPPLSPLCCREVGATMIGHFVTRLEVEAAKAGGTLSAARIRALAGRFIAMEQERFSPYYQRAWNECSHLREAWQYQAARHRVLDRVVIQRFSHLFPPRPYDEGLQGRVSRRLIPGFVIALDKMIGPARRAEAEWRMADILDRHRIASGSAIWEAIHTDPDTITLVDDLLVTVARTFTDFERRRMWVIDLINAHLGPAEMGDPDPHWRLGDDAATEILAALFAGLTARRHDTLPPDLLSILARLTDAPLD